MRNCISLPMLVLVLAAIAAYAAKMYPVYETLMGAFSKALF